MGVPRRPRHRNRFLRHRLGGRIPLRDDVRRVAVVVSVGRGFAHLRCRVPRRVLHQLKDVSVLYRLAQVLLLVR